MFVPRNQPVIDALDRCAMWLTAPIERLTGVKVYQDNPAGRRHRAFIWLPIALLIVVLAGFGLLVAGHEILGWMVICVVQSVSLALRQISTISEGTPRPDERQRELARNGHFWGLLAVVVLALPGFIYAALAQPVAGTGSILRLLTGHDWWMPDTPLAWLSFAFALIAVETNVAVIAASFATPRGDFGED